MVIAKHIHLLLVAVTLFNFIQCVSTRHHCFHVWFGLLLQPCESVHIALFKCSPCLQCIWPIRRHFLGFMCSVTEKRDAFTIIFGETLCHHRQQTYNILLPQFTIPRKILGGFLDLRKASVNFFHVRPSAWNNFAPIGRIMMKLYKLLFFSPPKKPAEKIQVSLKSDKNNRYFT